MLKGTRTLGVALLLALALLVMASMAARAGEPAQDPDTELGMRLYAENCAVCHGPEGQGRVGATLAKDWPSIRPDLTVKTIITNGVPGSRMPAWSQAKGGPFSEAEIEALTGYILSWQTGGAPVITPRATVTLRPPITPPPNVEGDPNRGAVLFDENCAVCHGAAGRGDGPGAKGLDPAPAVLAGLSRMPIASDGFYFWTISEGGIQFQGAMPPFQGTFKDEDIWKIVLFLRTL